MVSSTGLISGLEPEVLVVAELDFRSDLHDRLEDDGLALDALGDLDLGRCQGRQVLLAHGLAECVLDQLVEGFVETDDGPSTRSTITRGALPGRKPGTRVWRERRPTA
jgi:hypothetical protein